MNMPEHALTPFCAVLGMGATSLSDPAEIGGHPGSNNCKFKSWSSVLTKERSVQVRPNLAKQERKSIRNTRQKKPPAEPFQTQGGEHTVTGWAGLTKGKGQ